LFEHDIHFRLWKAPRQFWETAFDGKMSHSINWGNSMILEVAVLDVRTGREASFEVAFEQASAIISSMNGYVSHQLQRCLEKRNRYILLVNWQTLEDHTLGFRGSEEYQEWKKLLHHFYDPFPMVEHYEVV
jgi:heme-degrading monooxygenase HmoA